MLNIPIGISDFREIRAENYYYVDKTYFLEEFFKTKPVKVSLITRPRRFGKTLTMSMLSEFFDITKNSKELFRGLAISKNKELCSDWMNQYPIIFLSFKDIQGDSFKKTKDSLIDLFADLCIQHYYLIESKKLPSLTQKILRSFYDRNTTDIDIRNSLNIFIYALTQYWERPAIVLLDEYDVPINEAWKNNYYAQMIDFIRSFFGKALKDNKYLKFAVITGCLRISKESIFTGVNNFKCYTISNNVYSSVFGFTDGEVDSLLNDAGFTDERDNNHYKIKVLIKKWYDGYLFGKSAEIYCPWDILQYVSDLQDDHEKIPEAYWINTSENAIVRRLLEKDESNIKQALEALINGGYVRVALQESMSFDSLQNDQTLVWSILYATGYLTKLKQNQDKNNLDFIPDYSGKVIREGVDLVIPNKEIKKLFLDTIDNWFLNSVAKNIIFKRKLIEAIWNADSKIITAELQKILINSISYYDAQEYFYHAFLTGLLAGIQNLKVESNREYGLGRPDITISELNFNSIAIFEIKHLKIKKKKANARLKNPLIEYIIANETINDSKLLDRSLFFTQESDVNVQKKNF